MAKNSQYKILVADDEPAITEGLSELLKEEGYKTTKVYDGTEAWELVENQPFNLVLVDLMIPGMNGLEILDEIKKKDLLTEVIIITGKGTISTAVEAMKAGAYDYLTKPVQPNRLRTIIPRALERQDLVMTNKKLEETIKSMSRYEDMIGQHEKMRQVYRLVDSVADTTANVLITGESGTGKELVARAIHNKSSRADGPFIAVNCTAFPRDILENELFGHEKGAFTGAVSEKAGCFEMANGGTLFLDEIGEMPADTQAKLLRALEEKRFRRLGGTQEIVVDVRVIAATNRNIKKALADGALREDLYYRLSVMEIDLPPLRERMSDLIPLLNEFLSIFNERNTKDVKGFAPECLDALRKYDWPGNVRELKNVVERAVILSTGDTIELKHLPKLTAAPNLKQTTDAEAVSVGKTLHDIEKEVIFKTLKMTKNNKTKAAKILGISLKTMHNKLNKYYLERELEEES
ncbi:sigma-54-dependent Fis family transcriptional regulator [candidate division KSB1 bacterium]|nr:sigma-54-dependent Fis family transcriptional regulator [candidate division KSB1 bacterium]NIR72529.1 sigma-54-dependent Fis family transcriptional regulator [candidate division KSB1 bacterium]NIS23828.1 sigma-54-dependent Fis family transcriptional regulator [candidate division KSB1 bacterium]NIT70755.1 sigma-54-dependent Fis family transcriptional regulator [candidate division KSB1 bacterium]NIU24270.1 sigma-54-dependent Fis family transcriptional regulator [candidate division KSB1 bacteri